MTAPAESSEARALESLRSRHTALQQQLIDARARLDAEVARFDRINAFFAGALHLESAADLPLFVAETIVDVFELEFGVMYVVGADGRLQIPFAVFGASLDPVIVQTVGGTLLDACEEGVSFDARRLERDDLRDMVPRGTLMHGMYCYCHAADGTLNAMIFAGNTIRGADHYEPPRSEALRLFGMFATQVGSLLESFKSRAELGEKQRLIEASEKLRETTAIRQLQAEAVARIATSPALAAGDLPTLCATLTEQATTVFAVSHAGVWLLEQGGPGLVNVDSFDTGAGRHATGDVLSEPRYRALFAGLADARYVDGSARFARHRPAPRDPGKAGSGSLTAVLDAAVRDGDVVLGMVRLGQTGEPRAWTEGEIAALCQMADQVALAVANRRRAQTEGALARQEHFLRLLLDSIEAGVVIVDPATMTVEATNAKAVELYGAPESEIVGHVCHQLVCPHGVRDCPVLDHGLTVENAEKVLVRHDGSRLPVHKTVTRIQLDDGERLLETFTDLSARVAVESALIETRRRLEEALALASAACAPVRWRRVTLRSVGERSLRLAGDAALARGVALELEVPAEKAQLRTDADRLTHLLAAALHDAVALAPAGDTVRLVGAPGEGETRFIVDSVIDAGDESPGDLSSGGGPAFADLALAMSRRFVETLGGSVAVETPPDGTRRVTFTLPADGEKR